MHIQNCLHPVTIRNPYTKDLQVVPCGKCAACLSRKAITMQTRLQQESQCWKYTWFFTLTYDDKHLPVLKVLDGYLVDVSGKRVHPINGAVTINFDEDFVSKKHPRREEVKWSRDYINYCSRQNYQGLPYLSTVDVQRFMKRLRAEINRMFNKSIKNQQGFENETHVPKVRYYICGEYGPTHYRPHYHGLLFFNSDWLASFIHQFICDCWKYGSVDSSVQQFNASKYVSSYVTGNSRLPLLLQVRAIAPFAFYSKHPALGSLAVPSSTVKELFLTSSLTQVLFDRESNMLKSVPLWRFFQDKLYPRLSGFEFLSDFQRATLYGASSGCFDTFADFRKFVMTTNLSVYKEYREFLFNNKGKFESKLQRWYLIRQRIIYQAEIFGITVKQYVELIEQFYDDLKKNNLNLWYRYCVDYVEDGNPISDLFGMDSLFVRGFADCDIGDLTVSEYLYLEQFGIDLDKFFSDDLSERYSYQESLLSQNSHDFTVYRDNVLTSVINSSKTKRKNEYLRSGDAFIDLANYFDQYLI